MGSLWELDKDEPWREVASCRQMDPKIFFVDPSNSDGALMAKRICWSCPVRDLCLESTLQYPADQQVGVQGGMTEDERRMELRKRRRRARA